MENLKIVISGAGAAGTATCKMLLRIGIKDIVVCDRVGSIYKGRKEHMNPIKEWISENTNPRMIKGSLSDAMTGADVFIGVSAPNLITVNDIKRMSHDPNSICPCKPRARDFSGQW